MSPRCRDEFLSLTLKAWSDNSDLYKHSYHILVIRSLPDKNKVLNCFDVSTLYMVYGYFFLISISFSLVSSWSLLNFTFYIRRIVVVSCGGPKSLPAHLFNALIFSNPRI